MDNLATISRIFESAKARTIDGLVAQGGPLNLESRRQSAELVLSRVATGDLEGALDAVKTILDPQLVAQLTEFWGHFEYGNGYYSVKHEISKAVVILDQRYDHLVYDMSVSLLRIILFYFRVMSRPRKKVAVVVTVRNEGPWLVDWIAHYAASGIDIICYYNDVEDGSERIIRLCAENNLLFPIENKLEARVPAQVRTYEHTLFLNPVALDYEWLMFFDADEFLISTSGRDISSQLSHLIRVNDECCAGAILVNWRWMSDGFQYEWKEGTLFERFRSGLLGPWVKSIVRPPFAWSMEQIHVPILPRGCFALDSAGKNIDVVVPNISPPRNGQLELLHFYSKSFQEYALKKHRGRPTQGVAGTKREYKDFVWGLNGIRPFEVPSNVVANAAAKRDEILAFPGMSEACEYCVQWGRDKVLEIERVADLKHEFQALKSN